MMNFFEVKPLVKRSDFCFSDSTFLRTKGWSFFTVGSMLKKFLTKWCFTVMCLVLGESCGALQVAMHPLLSSHTFDFTKDSLFLSFSKLKCSVMFSKARHKGTKVLIAWARAMHSASRVLRAVSVCSLEVQVMGQSPRVTAIPVLDFTHTGS